MSSPEPASPQAYAATVRHPRPEPVRGRSLPVALAALLLAGLLIWAVGRAGEYGLTTALAPDAGCPDAATDAATP